MKSRNFVLVTLGLAGALCGGAAMAYGNDDVQWSVTIGNEGSRPVYRPAPVYVQPAYPVYSRGDHYQRPTRWDRDGDGIPNRYDRVYNPRWDRDGDHIPNWKDRNDNRRDDWHR